MRFAGGDEGLSVPAQVTIGATPSGATTASGFWEAPSVALQLTAQSVLSPA